MLPERWQKSLIKMGNALQNKVIQFHEKIVFDLVANPIYIYIYTRVCFAFKRMTKL